MFSLLLYQVHGCCCIITLLEAELITCILFKHPENNNTCRILSEHFSKGLCKNALYSVHIIEKLRGSGRDATCSNIHTQEKGNRMDAEAENSISIWFK